MVLPGHCRGFADRLSSNTWCRGQHTWLTLKLHVQVWIALKKDGLNLASSLLVRMAAACRCSTADPYHPLPTQQWSMELANMWPSGRWVQTQQSLTALQALSALSGGSLLSLFLADLPGCHAIA